MRAGLEDVKYRQPRQVAARFSAKSILEATRRPRRKIVNAAAIQIRPATASDGEAWLSLVDALADYEKLAPPTQKHDRDCCSTPLVNSLLLKFTWLRLRVAPSVMQLPCSRTRRFWLCLLCTWKTSLYWKVIGGKGRDNGCLLTAWKKRICEAADAWNGRCWIGIVQPLSSTRSSERDK